MKVIVTGVCGQLGHDIIKCLNNNNVECLGTDIQDFWVEDFARCIRDTVPYIKLDITNAEDIKNALKEIKPDAVIHCAAWTAVDMAENDEKVSQVRKINVDGTKNIADACKMVDAKMMYISTDYVFDGTGTEPWKPDCKDYNPLNVYGQSKLDGELYISRMLQKFFIVRTAWVFGTGGNNFINTMLNIAKKKDTISVVNDQVGTPTYSEDLARLLCDIIVSDKYGFYHATNEGDYISWYDFAVEIFNQLGKNINVVPVSTKEYGESVAVRPFNSRLDKSKIVENGFEPLPDWKDAVHRYLEEIKAV